MQVHSEMSVDLDHNHEKALGRPLRDCTDEQLIAELARRKVDIQHRVTSDVVAKYYHFESVLGYGASGKVYLVYHRVTGEKFACKVIKKDGQMNDAESMNTEIEIMKRVRHENIVTLYELFESAKCMWLILELVDGTGLRGGLGQVSHYSEAVAARYVRQICTGLHYLHTRGVVHRDLKIDNILLVGAHDSGVVKIADFGLSALLIPGESGYEANVSQKRKAFTGLTQMWGTPTHYAPELIERSYGPQADMWSLGCVIYEMLTGEEAYAAPEGMERKDLYANIKAARYDKRRLEELRISAEAQDLLAKIFTTNPVARLSASEALLHPWVSGEGHTENHRQHRLASVMLLAPPVAAGSGAARRQSTLGVTEGRRRSSLAAMDFLAQQHAGTGQHTAAARK